MLTLNIYACARNAHETLIDTQTYAHPLRTNGGELAIWYKPTALFCPYCGAIWGKIVPQHAASTPWRVETRCCSIHGDGSFLNYFGEPDTFIANAGRRLLIYELLLRGTKPCLTE